MTAQISDTFLFRGEEYSLIGIEGGALFSPEQYGMQPEMMHTACYRGFYGTYEAPMGRNGRNGDTSQLTVTPIGN